MQLGPLDKENTDAGLIQEWYAAYVKHHHEKKAATLLGSKGLEVFLPTQSSVRRWKDRRKTITLPLFPGYLFLRCALEKKLSILNTPGVFFLVENNGRPCAIPPDEIENIRRVVLSGTPTQPHPYMAAGDLVRIRSGILAGVQGLLARFKNQYHVVLTVESLRKAISVEVETDNVEPIRAPSRRAKEGRDTFVATA